MNIPENILCKLDDEQKKRAEAAKNPEEFLTVVKEVGYELSEEQLDSLSGGWGDTCTSDQNPSHCPPAFFD